VSVVSVRPVVLRAPSARGGWRRGNWTVEGMPAPDLPAPGKLTYFAGAGTEGTAALPAMTQAPAFLTMVLT
jgi:hypothetical protein